MDPARPDDAADRGGRDRTGQERRRADYRALFDDAPEPYLLTDTDGLVLLANERAHDVLRAEVVEGRPMADFVAPVDHDGLRQQLARAARGDGIHAWEMRLGGDAAASHVLVSIEPADGADDRRELRWVLWDAMPLALVRARLSRLLEDARGNAAAWRALAEWQATLLGAAAQDMRGPLDVIDTSVGSLLETDEGLDTPTARPVLERAAHEVLRLRRLLPTLLQLVRLQLEGIDVQRRTVDLRELAERVLLDLGGSLTDVEFSLAAPRVRADPEQLARVLVELFGHAQQHGPSRPAMRFASVSRGVDVELRLDVVRCTMADEAREVVSFPLLGTDRGGEGADGEDLGLSLVAVFARLHGGRAWVEGAPDDGTSFRVLLSNALPDTRDVA